MRNTIRSSAFGLLLAGVAIPVGLAGTVAWGRSAASVALGRPAASGALGRPAASVAPGRPAASVAPGRPAPEPSVAPDDAPAEQAGHPFETDEQRVPTLAVGDVCLIRGATVHSAVGPAMVQDVLVRQGRIAAVGRDLEVPEGATVVEAEGRHLAPGVVDCHSHMAIERGINEGTLSITAEVRILDSVDVDDVALYRALAGGVTCVRLLHGSANAIGGQDAVLKLRWHADAAEELILDGARTGIKFALGENPKRSGSSGRGRFPATRMGIESIYYRAFTRAGEYAAEWEAYEAAKKAGEDPVPPRRDLRLETLAGILAGNVDVHSHCYRADEILMLVRAMEHFGVRIATLQHVLEGYKIAHELAVAQVGASAFADWWGYKIEAYDAIPHAPKIMDDAGVLTSINSDSDEMVRRLYEEAAKSVRYAGMDGVRALQLVTLAPAKQLGLGDRIGSIEVGKDADLVLLNGHPFSTLSRVEWTMVDGVVEFTRHDAFGLDAAPLVADERVADFPAGGQDTARAAADQALLGARGPLTALVNGTLHPVSGPAIENGVLLMAGERIVALGADVTVPQGAQVVDLDGRHVWPGIVALGSGVGLHEIGSIRETNDTREIGGDQPDLRVTASIHAESAHVGVTRQNGVTRAQVTPQGGGPVRGRSAVVALHGDTWEEMLLRDTDMLHVSFPFRRNVERDALDDEREGGHDLCCGHGAGEMDNCMAGLPTPPVEDHGHGKPGEDGYAKSEEVKALKELFAAAREYERVRRAALEGVCAAPPYDPRLEALAPYALGEARVGLHASNAQTILDALRFAHEEGLDAVLYGAAEGWKVADRIATLGVPVVLGPIWALPTTSRDPYDAPFANAAVLHRAGVTVAITSGDLENERNLPFHAAKAAAFGLPVEEALRAITLHPARILGVDQELGSLAVGKRADVVVTDGHLLEITAPVTHLWIDGVRVDPNDNKQTRLAERYRARLERMQR